MGFGIAKIDIDGRAVVDSHVYIRSVLNDRTAD